MVKTSMRIRAQAEGERVLFGAFSAVVYACSHAQGLLMGAGRVENS